MTDSQRDVYFDLGIDEEALEQERLMHKPRKTRDSLLTFIVWGGAVAFLIIAWMLTFNFAAR